MAPSRAFRLPPPLLRYVHRVNSARKSVKPRHIVYATATTTLAAGATITLGFAGLALSGAHDAIVTLPSDISVERISGERQRQDELPTEYDLAAVSYTHLTLPTICSV